MTKRVPTGHPARQVPPHKGDRLMRPGTRGSPGAGGVLGLRMARTGTPQRAPRGTGRNESPWVPPGQCGAVGHRPRSCETQARRCGICGGNPLSSGDAVPPVLAGEGAASTHAMPAEGAVCGAPFGAHARWGLGPPPRLTSPSPRCRVGGGPDTDEGTRDPSIRAPQRGVEACGSFFDRGKSRGRDLISATINTPRGLRSET